MCFASSVVEAHKKLFIANAGGGNNNSSCNSALATNDKRDSLSGVKGIRSDKRGSLSGSSSSNSNSLKNTKMSRSKTRIQTEVCGDCGASGKTIRNCYVN